jgi:HlyD family secretion protein
MGIYTIQYSNVTPPELPLTGRPSLNPYPHGIAASGKVEAVSRNIAIAAPEPGVVAAVCVEVNQAVQKGDLLFQLDSRLLESERVQAEALLRVAKAELAKLEAAPRREDVAPLEAAVRQAQVRVDDLKDEYARLERALAKGAATEGELQRKLFERQGAEAALAEAQAQRDRIAAGTWDKDLAIARANLDKADAALRALALRLERLSVRAPVAGVVLKRNLEPGEFAQPGAASPALLLGDLSRLRVRAQVDEEDAPRLRPGLAATASVRGAARQEIPLTMLRIEPLALPKRDLTGSIIEVVDTRVVEVLYDLPPGQVVPLYPGQQVDVFIDAPAAETQPAG